MFSRNTQKTLLRLGVFLRECMVTYKQKIIPHVSLLHHSMPKMRIFNIQLLIMLKQRRIYTSGAQITQTNSPKKRKGDGNIEIDGYIELSKMKKIQNWNKWRYSLFMKTFQVILISLPIRAEEFIMSIFTLHTSALLCIVDHLQTHFLRIGIFFCIWSSMENAPAKAKFAVKLHKNSVQRWHRHMNKLIKINRTWNFYRNFVS